jgi:serine carboxypeptidase-like clade 2
MKAGLRVWVYSGDVDANVPLTGTKAWVVKLREQFSIKIIEPWREWWALGLHKYEDFVGGMVWKLQSFTLVSIKGAGYNIL